MIATKATRLLASPPTRPPRSCYDMEVEALQLDLADMHHEMNASVDQAARTNAQAYQRERAIWEKKIDARTATIQAMAANFQAEENEAMARYRADTLELERLDQHEISRLRQRLPRPGRPQRTAPPPRAHRAGTTRVCKPAPPTPASLARARDVFAWLQASGIQQRHAQGQPFIDDLCKAPAPKALRGISREKLLALHLELSALPAAAWSAAVATMARVLAPDASAAGWSGAGAWSARLGAGSETWFDGLKWLLSPRPIGWHWLAARFWPPKEKN